MEKNWLLSKNYIVGLEMKNNLKQLYITRVTDELYEEIEKIRNRMGLSKSSMTRNLLFWGIKIINNKL